MRCRKVRSYLSAYCNGELSSRFKPAVSEHLSTCSACRREEAVYRSMSQANEKLSTLTVCDDFNGKLLNRIAQERFSETRTKAFLPKRAPVILWRQAIPAFVTTSLMILLAIVAFSPKNIPLADDIFARRSALDDSYLTVQPVDNVRRTANLDKDWSLGNRLAWAERMNRLSNAIVQQGAWRDIDRSYGLMTASAQAPTPVPYVLGYYKVRPVVRVYMSLESPSAKEGGRAY
ncbi:MAG: hypothetical protein E3J26_05555 [Candidatus Zixiibacteriota bacterium]|nr:MAG: hypothetical protein E3J26_05555 [candidate division Zixibacteria bacterium]